MSHRRSTLGGLNIHRTTGAGKLGGSGKVAEHRGSLLPDSVGDEGGLVGPRPSHNRAESKTQAGASPPGELRRNRKLTPTDGQFLIQAQACGLTERQAFELWACQVGFAVAIRLEPHRRAEIEAASSRMLVETVMAVNARDRKAA